MIDVSDGLGGDAEHVATASGAELRLDAERVPLEPGVEQVADRAGIDPLELALAGGEDYELLVTLADQRLDEATSALARAETPLTVVGRVAAGLGVVVSDPAGRTRAPSGFDQLRPRQAPGGPA
jgi:thiamine-monophosphate kinase